MAATKDDSWVSFSELDPATFNALITALTVASNFITQPFTVVSIRQQAGSGITGDAHATQTANVVRAFRSSLQTIGVRGLFRGWMPMAIMGVPSNLIYLSTVEFTRERLQHYLRTTYPEASNAVIDISQAMVSSLLANFLSLVPYVPAEVVSSRVVVQQRDGLNSWQMSKKMFAEYGTRSFFRGFSSSMIVGVVASAQWWWSYSLCRRQCSKVDFLHNNPLMLDVVAGTVAGLTATLTSHPFDTVKTRIMSCGKLNMHKQFPSFGFTLKTIVKEEGFRALFRGLRASVYQNGLSSIGFALCYEFIKKTSAGKKHS